MSSLGSPSTFFLAKKKAYEVERSLRFDPNDTYMERTPSSAGNRLTWTFSCWVKRSNLGATNGARILSAYNDSNGEYQSTIKFRSTDKLQIFNAPSGSADTNLQTNALFRDVSAWYHIVVAVDMTQSTASDRVNLYINGVQETSFSTENYGSQNTSWWFNNNSEQSIGRGGAYNSQYFDGYLAEFNLIDGLQLTPASFGETNVLTGQWNPKKYTGSYGTNGFYLNFSDNSGTTATTLGKDYSGNGNNYTPYGFSVSAGSGNDSLEDTPTNNFCTSNSLVGYSTDYATFSNGNLDFNLAAHSSQMALGSFLIPETGKWYAEYVFSSGGLLSSVGIRNPAILNSVPLNGINILQFTSDGSSYSATPQLRIDNSYSENLTSGYVNNDIIGVKVDRDNGTIQFTKNGSNITTAVNLSGASDTSQLVFVANRSQGGSFVITGSVNFGQRPFSYLPTGYKSLCSQNLPDPTILLPNKHFETRTYTGTATGSGTQTLTGFQFQPDWTWIKSRGITYSHLLVDAVRGASKGLLSEGTSAEETTNVYGMLTAFTSDGYTMTRGSNDGGKCCENTQPYVSWNWNAGNTDGKTYTVKVVSDSGNKYRFDDFGTSAVTLDLAEGGTYIFDQSDSSNAGHPLRFSTTSNGTHGGGTEYTTGVTTAGTPGQSGAYTQIVVAASAPTLYYYCTNHSGMGGQANTNSTLGSSNFDGSNQTTVKVNASAGFSIISYTGTGSTNTIGHGLGVTPNVYIIKNRDASDNWIVYTTEIDGSLDFLYLNLTNAKTNSGNTAPTSSVIEISGATTNDSGNKHICYALSEVAGYSKFGSYTGNGNADGTFVYTGFKPAMLIMKASSGTSNWTILDNKRDPHNVTTNRLQPNLSNAEDTPVPVDFLSNGFKHRSTNLNSSGDTHIYMAFAESPFKNARAR